MARRAALVRHPLAIAGAIITTAAAVVFGAMAIAVFTGLFTNPYAGLVVFIAIPALFVFGLLLIPAGIYLERKQQKLDPTTPVDWPVIDFRLQTVRRITLVVTALTAANVMLILLAGYGSLHWMESPSFCGQVCHTPMQPQFTAWHEGPHGRVACVNCHIGEGPRAFVHAKLAGVRQLVQVATTSYPTPIPPGAAMPPGAQAATCASCHQPERTVGDRVRLFRSYGDDEENTETRTLLQLYLGRASASGRAIHWHADPATRVEYVSPDEGKTIPYVRLTRANGQVTEYVVADVKDAATNGARRVMDCIDCHNTVGHPIAQSADLAVDSAIARDLVSRTLPFARREGVRLLSQAYPSHDQGAQAIDDGLRKFYQSAAGSAVDAATLARTSVALQNLYRQNVFPTMQVTFGSYPDNRGHTTSDGCFRCHDDLHTTKDGTTINGDCEYCHKEIAVPALPEAAP